MISTNPSKKMMESLGMMTFPIYRKIKFMFQTTNHNLYMNIYDIYTLSKPPLPYQYFSYISISKAQLSSSRHIRAGCVQKMTHKSNSLSTITLLKSPCWGPHSQAYLNHLQDQILGSYFPLYGPINGWLNSQENK